MNLDELISRYNRNRNDFQTQLVLANYLYCPIEILEQLVNSNYPQVSEAARLHVQLAGEITAGWQEVAEIAIYNADLGQNDEIVAELLEFAPVPDFLVSEWMPWKKMQTAVENPYLPLEWRNHFLIRLAEHRAIEARIYAASCEHTPVPCLEILAGDPNGEIRTLVSFHPNSMETWFESIQQQRDLATNWQTLPQQLASLAASKWGWIRLAVAENPYTPGDVLLKFATESSFLLAIAKNPLAPTEALDLIAQKSDTYINKALAEHPNASESVLLQLPPDCNQIIVNREDFPNLPHSVLTKLASDSTIQQELAKANNNNNRQQLEQFIGNIFIYQNILRDGEINRCLELANDNSEIEKCLEKLLPKSHLCTCLEIAKNPTAENYILEQLANYPNFWHIEIRSTHPNTRSTSALNPLAFSRNLNEILKQLHDLRCAVVSHPNTPSDTLASFAYDSGDVVLELLAKNPNTPVDILAYLANNSHYLIRIAVAENPSTTLNILLELARDNDNYVRDIVDKNSSLDSLQRYQVRLNKIQEKLITPNYFLRSNATSEYRLELAKNIDTNFHILENYATSSIPLCRFVAYIHPLLPNYFYQIAADSLSWFERYAITQNPNIPTKIKQYLTQDANQIVRAAAKANNTDKIYFSTPKIPKTKSTSKQLLATFNILLPELSAKVNDPEKWEYQERYKTFLWSTKKQGQFSFAKFMENHGLSTKISLQDLCERWSKQKLVEYTDRHEFKIQTTSESIQKCQNLIQLLQNNLTNLQSYQVKLTNSKNAFNIIIGETNNCWLGLSCLLPARKEKSITSDIKDTSQIPSEILSLIEQINILTVDFNPIEQNIDFIRYEGIIWEISEIKELLIEKLLKTANFIKVETFSDRKVSGYSSVNSFLNTYLTNLETYTIGKNFPYYYEVYTVGQTPAKDWMIFNTQVSQSS